MHSQTLFWMLDRHMQPKEPGARGHSAGSTEFTLGAGPACGFMEAQVFEQLCAGCGGQGELSLLVLAADPAMLWRHVQGGLGKILHCSRGGGLKVQVNYEPIWTFFDMRRQAIYSMAGHLTELN